MGAKLNKERSNFGKGTECLVSMESAVRYNASIENLIINALGKSDEVHHVLDVGAGGGEFAVRLRDLGYHVTCVEPDTDHRKKLLELGFDVYASLDSVSEHFEGAYMINVLEHVRDDVKTLDQLREMLCPGGRLFVWVPACEVLYSDFDFSLGHYRRYTRNSLQRAMTLAGFEAVKSDYRDSLGWFAALVWKILPNADRTVPSSGTLGIYDRWVFPTSSAVDRVASRVVGKNVIATGIRGSAAPPR